MSVVDLVSDRDGIDTLINVEEMDFGGVLYVVGEECLYLQKIKNQISMKKEFLAQIVMIN